MVGHNIMSLQRARVIAIILLMISALLGVIPALAAVTSPQYHSNDSYVGSNSSSVLFFSSTSSSQEVVSIFNSTVLLPSSYLCGMDLEAKETPFGVLIRPFKFGYDFVFIASVITITVLYILIYKEIYTRRKVRRDKKHKLMYNSFINGGKSNLNRALQPRSSLLSPGDTPKSIFGRIFFCFDKTDVPIGKISFYIL
jgi:hypothetical protein